MNGEEGTENNGSILPSTPAPTPLAQTSMATSSWARTALLVGTGAKVGLNYLKYYGKKSLYGQGDKEKLHQDNADDVYATFSQLKGGPLKVAQMLSMDRNLLPGAYAKTFAQAQYSAPPLSYPLVARTFRREFGREPTEMFDSFSRKALHGASIGQVHRAAKNGRDYAVKVQYPGVAQSLKSDLAVVKPLALQMMGVRESDVAPYFKEVEARLLEETDYQLELQRSMTLSQASAQVGNVRFPGYYPEFSSARVLTMDWVGGVALDQFAAAQPSQEERDRIGQALWDFYHFQIHDLRLFHADPHPGNFKVCDRLLWVLDFGCTKQLDDEFYYSNFCLLDSSYLENRTALAEVLHKLGILLPSDTAEQREQFLDVCIPSLELLARPFREESFDFGDPAFMRSIYEIGQNNRQNDLFRDLKGARGSAHSVYVNRAYFGLYSLLTLLQARVQVKLPSWIRSRALKPV